MFKVLLTLILCGASSLIFAEDPQNINIKFADLDKISNVSAYVEPDPFSCNSKKEEHKFYYWKYFLVNSGRELDLAFYGLYGFSYVGRDCTLNNISTYFVLKPSAIKISFLYYDEKLDKALRHVCGINTELGLTYTNSSGIHYDELVAASAQKDSVAVCDDASDFLYLIHQGSSGPGKKYDQGYVKIYRLMGM